jgi:hypothetical protein
MRKIALFILLFIPAAARGQGVASPAQVALTTVNGTSRPMPLATITVCGANAAGIPCAPALASSIYANSTLTSPFTGLADANGNYQFFALPGQYTVTVTGSGSSGFSYQVTLAAVVSAGQLTMTGGLVTHTFNTPYIVAPICTATSASTTNGVEIDAVTTTSVSMNGNAGDVVNWHCTPASN